MDRLSGEQSVPLLLLCRRVLVPPSPLSPPLPSTRPHPEGAAQHRDALVRRVQCAGTMVGLLTPGGVLGSPQPARQELLSRVRCPGYGSHAGMWHFFLPLFQSPLLTTRCPHFKPTHTHALSHFERVRVCYPRSDFSPSGVETSTFYEAPPRPPGRLFLSVFLFTSGTGRKTAGLAYTTPCISIT